ncbi:13008_t:CDS:1 [Dentiscutata erythropus]|uniref:13008_t:CDS:1 n=1 Tax=Dentiscutata erythropus TaxID=1348616 RepID=A0A9N9NWP2_9GLOM|nr:13008_t:CDS:1 [Dentiscutata erythropus]
MSFNIREITTLAFSASALVAVAFPALFYLNKYVTLKCLDKRIASLEDQKCKKLLLIADIPRQIHYKAELLRGQAIKLTQEKSMFEKEANKTIPRLQVLMWFERCKEDQVNKKIIEEYLEVINNIREQILRMEEEIRRMRTESNDLMKSGARRARDILKAEIKEFERQIVVERSRHKIIESRTLKLW